MKLFTKRNIIIAVSVLVVAVAVGLVIGLAPEPEPEQPLYATELTEQKRAELIQSLQNMYGKGNPELIPGTGKILIAKNDHSYYYGTYNGYDVVFIRGNLDMVWRLRLGDEVFYEPCSSSMYLHRKGEFVDILEGYEAGLITDDDVKMIAKIRRDNFVK